MKVLATKILLAALLAAAAFTAGNIVAGLLVPDKVSQADERYGAIVRLVANDHTFCTGTVVRQNLIITAAHCVLTEVPALGTMLISRTVEIRPSTNENIGTVAYVNYASPQMDQAVLTGNFKAYKVMKYTDNPEKLSALRVEGEKFISCGFPLNGAMYCNHTSFHKPEDFFWDINGVLIPGMSGGPTFLVDGTMVAVNVAVHGDKSVISPIYNVTKNIQRSK